MEPMQLLANLAAARPAEMRNHLESFEQRAPWYSRYCTYIRTSILSVGVDEVYALTDRISRVVLESPALIHDPQTIAYLTQIERKLFPDTAANIAVLSSRVTRELVQNNCLCIQVSSISLKMLGQHLLDPRCASVHSIKVSTGSIPVALVKEACSIYPDDTLTTFITKRCSEQLLVRGQKVLITTEVLQRIFNISHAFAAGEPSCYPFPDISPRIVIRFINTLINPEVYQNGHAYGYLKADENGQITLGTLLSDYVTLIDFLQHPPSKAELKNAILRTLHSAIMHQDIPDIAQIKCIFLLKELLEGHDAVIEPPVYNSLHKFVSRFFSQKEGISISTVQQLGNIAIPFEGLRVVIRPSLSALFDEYTFRAHQTQSLIGQKIMSSDEDLFCCYLEGELFFLPKLAIDASDKKVRVKAKNMTFLLSPQASLEPVWNAIFLLSFQECVQIAQVLEGTKEIGIQEAVNLVAIAYRSNSRMLYHAALSQLFMAAQKQQESTTYHDIYRVLEAIKKLQRTIYTIKDCTHLYDIAEYMVARCIVKTGLPVRVKDGLAAHGESWQFKVAEYNNGGPLYNYDEPREKIQTLCYDVNLKQLHLHIDQHVHPQSLQALGGFSTLEFLTITSDSDYVMPLPVLRSLREFSSLKTLRLLGFCRANQEPYTLAELTQILQLPPKVCLVVQ